MEHGGNGGRWYTLDAAPGLLRVEQALTAATQLGLNTVRTWAHTSSPLFPFQTAPGLYDPRGLRALDAVLQLASRNGLKVILSFADNWKYYNGVDQYVDWSDTAPRRTQSRPADQPGKIDIYCYQVVAERGCNLRSIGRYRPDHHAWRCVCLFCRRG